MRQAVIFIIMMNHIASHCDARHSHGKTNIPRFICFRQDVAFFDANKTGQLVNRLTADIQEFKSSFKLVISQV